MHLLKYPMYGLVKFNHHGKSYTGVIVGGRDYFFGKPLYAVEIDQANSMLFRDFPTPGYLTWPELRSRYASGNVFLVGHNALEFTGEISNGKLDIVEEEELAIKEVHTDIFDRLAQDHPVVMGMLFGLCILTMLFFSAMLIAGYGGN